MFLIKILTGNSEIPSMKCQHLISVWTCFQTNHYQPFLIWSQLGFLPLVVLRDDSRWKMFLFFCFFFRKPKLERQKERVRRRLKPETEKWREKNKKKLRVPLGSTSSSSNFCNFKLREEKTEKTACDQELASSIPPGSLLHHPFSHHASPDRTLQMHYGVWGRRARGRRALWIFDKTWDDQTEVVRRGGGSSILHQSATLTASLHSFISALCFMEI